MLVSPLVRSGIPDVYCQRGVSAKYRPGFPSSCRSTWSTEPVCAFQQFTFSIPFHLARFTVHQSRMSRFVLWIGFMASLLSVILGQEVNEDITIASLPTFTRCQVASITWTGGSRESPHESTFPNKPAASKSMLISPAPFRACIYHEDWTETSGWM